MHQVSLHPRTHIKAPPLNIAKNGQYKVLEGDTISRIAKSHGVSNQSLIASNETLDPNKIKPGQIINIPGEAPNSFQRS